MADKRETPDKLSKNTGRRKNDGKIEGRRVAGMTEHRVGGG